MSDLFSFDLADGLASGECPLCYAVACHMRRWLESFWREGRQEPRARQHFYAAGGFCHRHVWLLDELVTEHPAAIADVYGKLAHRDLEALDDLLARTGKRRQPVRRLRRPAECAACSEEAEAMERKAEFFLELLATSTGRERYERGRGVCFVHLLALLEAADDEPMADYLLADWRRRLAELRRRLEHFDRTRDHHYAAERTDDDERSCSDVIRQYVGARMT